MRHKMADYWDEKFFAGVNNVESLERYILHHLETGGFLRAVLEGDLYNAVTKADIENQQRLYHLVRYIVTHLPEKSYGTPEKVKAWISKK